MAFLGMRGTGDFVSNQRPENWRDMVLRLYPNGTAPLTAITAKLASEATDDPVYHWWQKGLPDQQATVTGVWTNAALNVAYVSGGVATDTLYIQMSAADAGKIRLGHVVLLRDASDYDVDVNARVTAATVINGASSYITVALMEADDNSASNDLSNCDLCLVIGSANEEGADTPTVIHYDPTEYYNQTQIFRTPTSITGSAAETHLRTGPQVAENKREALELHSIEMEKAFLWGLYYSTTGSGGKPLRYTNGIVRLITTNRSDFTVDTDYSGQTWLQSGETWLDSKLEQVFRYGRNEKLAFVGSGTMLGLNRLAKANANINITPMTTSYGLEVDRWITPFGRIYMKTHPLFSYTATNRNSMLILELEKIKYRYLRNRDTKFLQNRQGAGIDGKIDEFLTECGLELHHEECFAFLNGFNQDNVL